MSGTEPRSRRHGPVAFALIGVVLGMLGLSYAAVPLYQIFCQVTGYAGTTQRSQKASGGAIERRMAVRFDANVARGMPWEFKPLIRSLELRLGEDAQVAFEARNLARKPVTGTATFNVTPAAAGRYFNKIECFCFVEQTLEPGRSAELAVSFFIDPELVNDTDARRINEITLSYTFFPVEGEPGVAAADDNDSPGNGS